MTQKTALSFAKATARRANKIPEYQLVSLQKREHRLTFVRLYVIRWNFFLLVWTEIAGGEGKGVNTW